MQKSLESLRLKKTAEWVSLQEFLDLLYQFLIDNWHRYSDFLSADGMSHYIEERL